MEKNVKKEDLKNIPLGEVHFIMMAEGGAMGEPGAVYIVTDCGDVFHCNYVYEDIKYSEIEEALPMLKECEFGLFGIDSTTPEGWNYVNLGMGNHLIVKDDVYSEFIEIVGKDTEPSKLFGLWFDAALQMAKSKN